MTGSVIDEGTPSSLLRVQHGASDTLAVVVVTHRDGRSDFKTTHSTALVPLHAQDAPRSQ